MSQASLFTAGTPLVAGHSLRVRAPPLTPSLTLVIQHQGPPRGRHFDLSMAATFADSGTDFSGINSYEMHNMFGFCAYFSGGEGGVEISLI